MQAENGLGAQAPEIDVDLLEEAHEDQGQPQNNTMAGLCIAIKVIATVMLCATLLLAGCFEIMRFHKGVSHLQAFKFELEFIEQALFAALLLVVTTLLLANLVLCGLRAYDFRQVQAQAACKTIAAVMVCASLLGAGCFAIMFFQHSIPFLQAFELELQFILNVLFVTLLLDVFFLLVACLVYCGLRAYDQRQMQAEAQPQDQPQELEQGAGIPTKRIALWMVLGPLFL